MKGVVVCLFTIFSLITYSQKQLTTEEVKAFKSKIEQGTKQMKSMKTDFNQNKHLSFMSNDVISKGKMFLNEEGFLKWEYTSPSKYSIIFKNNMVYIDDNGKKNSVNANNEVFKRINKLISGSVNGQLFNDKEFVISYFKEGNQTLAKFLPSDKGLKKYIQEVFLYFPNNETTVSKVKLIEPSGDYTEITFVNKEINAKIDPKIFTN
ncbi:MAG: outer membrane lipoprotein carrier protein LolA [Brumimicrobium sp.]|nr:outer membrane lipoprotein carrier protein LolA [Brumimicrobium sp.]MCO5268997.1 outer membrane lipoprotein carrier protein LolA [Brumimicrobium sp.]